MPETATQSFEAFAYDSLDRPTSVKNRSLDILLENRPRFDLESANPTNPVHEPMTLFCRIKLGLYHPENEVRARCNELAKKSLQSGDLLARTRHYKLVNNFLHDHLPQLVKSDTLS